MQLNHRLFKWVTNPITLYVILAMVILGPALRPGYVLLLDMIWSPNLQLNDHTTNGTPPHLPLLALMWVLGTALPNWLIQKVLLMVILAGAGYGAHRAFSALFNQVAPVFRYLAGILYILNPFVAERLMAGHWLVLAGYAFTPYLLQLTHKACTKPSRATWMRLSLAYLILPSLSIHWWYMMTPIIATSLLIAHRKSLKQRAVDIGLYCTVFLVTHSYWLFAFGANKGGQLSSDDFDTFATAPDATWGVFVNVLSLYGFWNDRVFLPKDFFTAWVFVGMGLVALGMIGALHNWRSNNRTLVFKVLSAAFLPITIVAVGYGSSLTRPATELLVDYLPGFLGMRDTAKFVGVLALIIALGAPLGLSALSAKSKQHGIRLTQIVILVVIVSMNGLLLGSRGQIKAYDYPLGWQSANTHLYTNNASKVLILPWKGYLNINFANNAFIANPARSFFDSPIVQGDSTGNSRITTTPSSLDTLIASYPRLSPQQIPEWLTRLSDDHKISHVMVIKTDSWAFYDGLAEHSSVNNQDILIVEN